MSTEAVFSWLVDRRHCRTADQVEDVLMLDQLQVPRCQSVPYHASWQQRTSTSIQFIHLCHNTFLLSTAFVTLRNVLSEAYNYKHKDVVQHQA